MKIDLVFGMLLLALALLTACTPSDKAATTPTGQPSAEGVKYVLNAAPAAAQEVAAARKAASDAEDVVVVGRIGGSTDPWLEGIAAFSIVDPALKACSDIPGDKCPTPWDYCCETADLKHSIALVKIVDETGQVVQADARTLLGVKELDTITVRGKAQRDDAGNLTILASGIHVQH